MAEDRRLQREGLVVSAQGRGVFVHRQPLIPNHRDGSTATCVPAGPRAAARFRPRPNAKANRPTNAFWESGVSALG
jgi:hypothetical protein